VAPEPGGRVAPEGMLAIDKPAPRFCLPGLHNGKEVSVCLDDLRGRFVILWFFSADFTFV